MQTPGGIFVRCLLRPEMKVNGTIKINNASVQLAAPDLSIREEVSNEKLPSLAGDGLYKVLVIRRIGDTHGRPWYNEMLCLAADGSGWTPTRFAGLIRGVPPYPSGGSKFDADPGSMFNAV